MEQKLCNNKQKKCYNIKKESGQQMTNEILDFVLEYLGNMRILCRRIKPPFSSLVEYDLGLRSSILKMSEEREVGCEAGLLEAETIYYLTDRFLCHYVIMDIPGEGNYLLVGPVLVEMLGEAEIYKVMEENHIPGDFYWQLEQYYRESTNLNNSNGVFSLINQLGAVLYGRSNLKICYLDSLQMEVWEEYFNNYELQIPADPVLSMNVLEKRYAAEEMLLEAVYEGNTALAMNVTSGVDALVKMGQRLPDELRDRKNQLITLNTLLRKEAQRACVHPWHIDRLSNSNVVKIERIEMAGQLEGLIRQIVKSYCELVQKHSLRGYSLLTRKIINAVDADLTQDLSLKVFAEQLNVNASYLSGLFKNDVGQTLTDYVTARRMHQARKLLQTTSLSVQDVACRVGVPDVHYFNRLFKKSSEMSPREYRNKIKNKGAVK